MELIALLIAPLPIGWFIRNRVAAYVTHVALFSFIFTFQTLFLILEWVGGSHDAFGRFPHRNESQVWSYVCVNALIYAAGLGLVTLGHYLAQRYRTRAARAVNLDPVR